MGITNHFVDVNDNAWFTVSTPEYDISENILSQHMLSIDPTQIELYQYLHSTSLRHITLPSISNTTSPYIQESIQCMITDYFEVDFNTGALELIENSLVSHRQPSTTILQTMISLLLRKREVKAQQKQYKSYWILADKTHDLLLKMVALFGPKLFDGLWNTFDSPQIKKQQQQQQRLYQDPSDASYGNEDEDTSIDMSADSLILDGLGAFDDFWDFVSQCFKQVSPGTTVLQAKSYLQVLDILITILEQDFRSKRDSPSDVKKTTILKTLRKNMIGGWDRFEHYLDILVGPFASQRHVDDDGSLPPMIHIKQKEYAGRLLNLMVAISLYDLSLSMSDLADQTFRRATQLGPDCLTNIVQYIVFDSFILQVCHSGFMDANWSAVSQQYHYLKKKQEVSNNSNNNLSTSAVENTSSWLEKWIHAYLKLQPSQIQWLSIYLHVWMIKQYYHSILKISTLRYDGIKSNDNDMTMVIRGCNDLDEVALSALLDDSHLQTWQLQQVNEWLKQCRRTSMMNDDDKQWEQRIGWLLDTFTF